MAALNQLKAIGHHKSGDSFSGISPNQKTQLYPHCSLFLTLLFHTLVESFGCHVHWNQERIG